MEEYASEAYINDLSPAVFAFWHTAIHESEWLCDRIHQVSVSVATWRRQRAIFRRADTTNLRELGFATLFLNRVNRSGILSGGLIGGVNQDGPWKLDARFGREELIARVHRIGRYGDRIRLSQLDACQFTKDVVSKLPRKTLVFYDPPYIDRGRMLYLNEYKVADHVNLSKYVQRLKQHWLVTYDAEAVQHGVYAKRRRIVYDMHYVAQDRSLGREVMFVSDHTCLPPSRHLLDRTMTLVPNLSRFLDVASA